MMLAYSSQPAWPDAPYPSLAEMMDRRISALVPQYYEPTIKRRPRDSNSKDGRIRSVLTSQPMTTQQVMRAIIAAGIDVGPITTNQLRVRLYGMAQRGIGVRAVTVAGGPKEWIAV